MLHIVAQIVNKSEENLVDFAVSIRYCTSSLEAAQGKLEELQKDKELQESAFLKLTQSCMRAFHVADENRSDVEYKTREFLDMMSRNYTPWVKETEYKIISVEEDQDIDKIIGRLYADNRW
jgi:hypothetical protein